MAKQQPTIEEIARGVAKALRSKRAWTTGSYARDKSGCEVFPKSKRATCWCALGHATRLFGYAAKDSLMYAYIKRFGRMLSDDNDQKGREYVRDRLLELAGARRSKATP